MKTRPSAGRRLLVAVGLLVLIAAVLSVAQHLLATRATQILEAHVLPSIEKQLGRQVELDRARLHLFAGRMQLDGLRIANPPGFTPPELAVIDTTHLQVRLLPLLRGTLEITSLAVTNARVAIIRNEDGELNLASPQAAAEARRSSPPAAGTPSNAPTAPTLSQGTSRRTPKQPTTGEEAILRDLSANVALSYLDYTVPDGPFSLNLALVIEGRNLGAGGPDAPRGMLSIRGHQQGNPQAFVTSLHADFVPSAGPADPAFDLEGTIRNIRLSDLGEVSAEWDVACASADVLVDASCRNGVYAEGSQVTVVLHQPRLTGGLARQARHLSLPETLKVPIPLRGPADKPVLDVETALIQTVLGNLATTLGTMLEETTIDGKKLDGDLGEAAKKLGEILKNW